MSGAAAAAAAYRSPSSPGAGAGTITDETVSGNNVVGYGLEADGDIRHKLDGVVSDAGDWLSPKVGMAGFEAQATVVSNTSRKVDVKGDATGAWRSLATTREWTIQAIDTDPAVTVELTIEIRKASDHSFVAAATITLHSDKV